MVVHATAKRDSLVFLLSPSLLPMQGVDGQREEDQEKEEEEDIVYQSSIPGVQINVTLVTFTGAGALTDGGGNSGDGEMNIFC